MEKIFDRETTKTKMIHSFKIKKRPLEEHLKKMTPNLDVQFIIKESGNSVTTAKLQSARLLPH